MKTKEVDRLEVLKGDEDSINNRQIFNIVLRLSIPAILAEISSNVMSYIDASMVGNLGKNATSAIGLVSSSTWLVNGVAMSITMGFSVLVAQLIGAKRDEEARNIFRQALIVCSIIALFATSICLIIGGKLPIWLNGEKEIIKDSSLYFRIYMSGLLTGMLSRVASNMLACSGDIKTPSILNTLMCLFDVVLNFIFINVLGLGVCGAALGTVFAEAIVCVMMLYEACIKSEKLAFSKGGSFKLHQSTIFKAIKLGAPVSLERAVICIAYVVSTLIVSSLGSVAIAAHSLAITAEGLCYMPGYGISTAATTMTGQCIGANKKRTARRCANISVILGIAIMSVAGVIMYILAPVMFRMLSNDKEVIELGIKILRIEAIAEPMFGASIVCSGALRGAGDTLASSIMNLVSIWCVRIPLSILLVTEYGLVGVWVAMCIELIFRGIIFLIRLIGRKWLERKDII